MTDGLDKFQRYNRKVLKRPKINEVRDVDPEVIEQLDAIAEYDGTKKKAITTAITDRFKKLKKQSKIK